MAQINLPRLSRLFGTKLPGIKRFSEMGVSGTPVYAGYVLTQERNTKLIGSEKWRTFADILANTTIVAAGVRYFLNIVARPNWSCEPADDTDESKRACEFVEQVLFEDLQTPWSRVVRRSGTYRFYGFAVQEWTAARRDDGTIGFKDVDTRPQWTIVRWDVNESGSITGMWQRDPLTGRELGLPRGKLLYLVDDTLTDSPEGMGLLRHVVEPNDRLHAYLRQEGYGFERDLRGVPIGRAPLEDLNKMVSSGQITEAAKKKAVDDLLDFVRLERKTTDTAILLSSQPYENVSDSGISMASQYKWGVELANGAAPGLSDVNQAIVRINQEMARVLGIEHLMLGADSAGSFALAKEKASALYTLANSVLRDIRLQTERDLLWPLWSLNGFADKYMPKLKTEDVQPKDVAQITAALREMATAGTPIMPDDEETQNFVRDLLGAPHVKPLSPEQMGFFGAGGSMGGAGGNKVFPGFGQEQDDDEQYQARGETKNVTDDKKQNAALEDEEDQKKVKKADPVDRLIIKLEDEGA